MVVSNGCIADEVFQRTSFQIARHDFAFCVGSKRTRIPNLAAEFNTSDRGLQIVRVRQRTGFDLDRIVRPRSRQTEAAPTLRSYDTSKQCPARRRWLEFGGRLGTA